MRWHGFGEMISLVIMASLLGEHLALLAVFHSCSNDSDAKACTHCNDRADDGSLGRVRQHSIDQ